MFELDLLQSMESWQWPADASTQLASIIRDTSLSTEDRLLAAELAGPIERMDDALAEVLLETVLDEETPSEIRGTAAIALGPILEYVEQELIDPFFEPDLPISEEVYHRILSTLQTVYEDESAPIETRRRALEAGVRATQDWHARAIADAFANEDISWKQTAVFCMRFRPGFEAEIEEALKSDDDEVHRQAVLAAGSQELSSAWFHVRSLAASENTEKWLRIAAIQAAADIRPESAEKILRELMDHSDEDIAITAENALLESGQFDMDDWDL
ncbi:MAG: hypothetical protein RL885_20675 [Planctomycetota bacterium]